MSEPRTIFEAIHALAESGLGYEDIAVRLQLTPRERNVAKQIVLSRRKEGKAA